MRSNIEGALIRDVILRDRVRMGATTMSVTATYTMTDKFDPVQFLSPTAARTVLLPAETRGAWYWIFNTASGNFDLTVKEDSNTTTIGVIPPGGSSLYCCDGTTWFAPSDVGGVGGGGSPIEIGDVTAYTVLQQNSGRLHIIPDVTSSITVTLPTPDEGLNYRFVYGGAAADAQNHIITGGAGNFLKGNIQFADLDAGAGADEMSAVFGNGSSHITFTMTTPANYEVLCSCNGTLWYVTGYVLSNTACAFS